MKKFLVIGNPIKHSLSPRLHNYWLKKNNISNKEMLKTFNCGVGFCIIVNPKNLKKINRYFSKKYKPYVIGKISEGKIKVKLNGNINWLK